MLEGCEIQTSPSISVRKLDYEGRYNALTFLPLTILVPSFGHFSTSVAKATRRSSVSSRPATIRAEVTMVSVSGFIWSDRGRGSMVSAISTLLEGGDGGDSERGVYVSRVQDGNLALITTCSSVSIASVVRIKHETRQADLKRAGKNGPTSGGPGSNDSSTNVCQQLFAAEI